MFATGPAPIATSRFHVRAFQYASGPSASSSSLTPFSATVRAAGEICLSAKRVREGRDFATGGLQVVSLEGALHAVGGYAEHGRLLHCAAEAPLRVMRDRPVHPGDRHETARGG